MQKWEYARLICAGEHVVSVDGQKLPGKQMALWREDRAYPLISDYIERMGQEGWELVGLTPIKPDQGSGDCLMMFKRPIEEHASELFPVPDMT